MRVWFGWQAQRPLPLPPPGAPRPLAASQTVSERFAGASHRHKQHSRFKDAAAPQEASPLPPALPGAIEPNASDHANATGIEGLSNLIEQARPHTAARCSARQGWRVGPVVVPPRMCSMRTSPHPCRPGPSCRA